MLPCMYKCSTIADCMNGRYGLQATGRFQQNAFVLFYSAKHSLCDYFRRGNTVRQGLRRKLQKGAAIFQTKCAFTGLGIGEGIAPVLGEGEGFGLHKTIFNSYKIYKIQ